MEKCACVFGFVIELNSCFLTAPFMTCKAVFTTPCPHVRLTRLCNPCMLRSCKSCTLFALYKSIISRPRRISAWMQIYKRSSVCLHYNIYAFEYYDIIISTFQQIEAFVVSRTHFGLFLFVRCLQILKAAKNSLFVQLAQTWLRYHVNCTSVTDSISQTYCKTPPTRTLFASMYLHVHVQLT